MATEHFGLGRPLSENDEWADVWGTSSLESWRPPDVICGAAILDDTIQDGGAGKDVNQDLGIFFRPLLQRRRKMAALPLPVAILDDIILASWTGNEVIQDGERKRKGRHFLRRRRNGGRKIISMLVIISCELYFGDRTFTPSGVSASIL